MSIPENVQLVKLRRIGINLMPHGANLLYRPIYSKRTKLLVGKTKSYSIVNIEHAARSRSELIRGLLRLTECETGISSSV
jgi:hypothetical protein